MTRRYALTAAAALWALLAASTAVQAEGRWRSLPIRSEQQYALGMPGGAGEQHMHSIARSPSEPEIIYLSHDCAQIWRSEDGGATWLKPRAEGMYVKSGQSIEVDPAKANIVFAVIDSSSNYLSRPYEGLYRSTDYGETWELVLQTNSEVQRVYQHCISPDRASVTADGAQRWYVAIPTNGLYASTDGGLTWDLAAGLASTSNVYSVQAHRADGQTVYLGTGSGLLRSTERGANLHAWGDLPSGAVSCIAMHPTDADCFYVTVSGVGLYRTTDGGAHFTLVRSTDATGVFINEGFPDVIYLVSLGSDLRISRDGGATWTTPTVIPPLGLQRDSRDEIDGSMTGISPDPRDSFTAVAYSNAWLSKTTDGATFSDTMGLFTGYNWGWWNDAVAYDVVDPNRMIFFCADIGMVITENGGLWWERHKAPWSWYTSGMVSWRGMYAGDFYPLPGSDIFVASIGMYWDCRLLRSDNAGDSYTLIEDDPENYLFVGFNTDNPSICYAGNKRSTDGGVTFATIPYLAQYSASILGMCKAQPNTIYAMSYPRDTIFRSDDAGVTWRLYTQPGWRFNGLDSKPTFEVDPADPNKIYTLDGGYDLASFDGTTWTSLGVLALAGETPYRNFVHAVKVDPRHSNIIYAQLFAAGFPQMFRSTDSGATWEDITYNLPRSGSGALSVHPLTGDLMRSDCAGTRVYPPPYASAESIFPDCPCVPPVARAGEDMVVFDADGDGVEMVVLNGSASYGPDVAIVDQYWSEGDRLIGFNTVAVDVLSVGTHTLTLTVTDADGARDTDTLFVTVEAAGKPGDANGDGAVDIDDFVILKNNFGAVDASWDQGDFNGDGAVDIDDFVILKNNFGQ